MIRKAMLLAGLLIAANACVAQQFPDKPIKLIIPYAAGGTSDVTIRSITTRMEPQLGQPVILENRPGAAAMIGSSFVAQAPADGYTLLWTFPSAISSVFVKAPPFDVRTDFVPVSAMCMSAHVMAIGSSVPAKSLPEFVEYSKKNPGRLNYAQSANSTMLPMELFKSAASLDIVGVPYKGSAPATTALIAGEVQAIFGLLGSFKQLEAAGKVRIIAGLSQRRTASAPDLPTFVELGYPDMILPQTTMFLARRSVPAERLTKLSGMMTTIVGSQEVGKLCADSGGDAVATRGPALQKHLDDEMERWRTAASRAKFQPTE